MGTPRIIAIDLDERTILWRSREIDQERRVALLDLLESNYFAPKKEYPGGYDGPYRVAMSVEDGRLVLDIRDSEGNPLERIIFGLARFRKLIRDYFGIYESYQRALDQRMPSQIETVDMARRAIHNEAAELVRERFGHHIDLDFDTARRLFTLICVLHMRA